MAESFFSPSSSGGKKLVADVHEIEPVPTEVDGGIPLVPDPASGRSRRFRGGQ
jgi:hypothetical protein